MGTRLELQELLEDLLGSEHVYFQPPENLQMHYPCIVYKRDDISSDFANNTSYRRTTRYMVTVFDKNPDSEIPDKVAALPLCLYDRGYAAYNLNHDVFLLHY